MIVDLCRAGGNVVGAVGTLPVSSTCKDLREFMVATEPLMAEIDNNEALKLDCQRLARVCAVNPDEMDDTVMQAAQKAKDELLGTKSAPFTSACTCCPQASPS